MPQNLRHYLYPALLSVTGVLLIAGLVLFWAAISFEGYITALMTLTLAGCSFLGARELKSEKRTDMQALVEYFSAKKTNQDDPTAGN
jgi:hypothetical protein